MIPPDARIVVAGAGSVGGFVGGLLTSAGRRVTLLARAPVVAQLGLHGMRLTDRDGGDVFVEPDRIVVTPDPAVLADADVVLVTVKSGATATMGALIAKHCGPGAVVVSLQNGVGNVARLAHALPGTPIVAGMVPYNIVSLGTGRYHRGTGGVLTIARGTPGLAALLEVEGLRIAEHDDMPGVLWGKVLINLNNALNALSGIPLREQLMSRGWRRVLADMQEEGLAALAAAEITPVAFGPLPPGRLPTVLRLPTPLFRVAAAGTLKIDPTARSSMWEDLERRRPTEIGELQGAIIRLAAAHGLSAPRCAAVAAHIARAEAANQGSPCMAADAV